jgi:tetratricopeptide (TPR) repeat protein
MVEDKQGARDDISGNFGANGAFCLEGRPLNCIDDFGRRCYTRLDFNFTSPHKSTFTSSLQESTASARPFRLRMAAHRGPYHAIVRLKLGYTAMSKSPDDRIDSWKAIAAFFGRDERTVKRWEKERGLPVHRLPGERGGVFAYRQDLTDWLNSASAEKRFAEPAPVPPLDEEKGATYGEAAQEASAYVVLSETPSRSSGLVVRTAWLIAISAILALSPSVIRRLHGSLRNTFQPSSTISLAPPKSAGTSPEAHVLYLNGRYYWSHRTEGGLNDALDAFTQAVVEDSDDPQAYAGLAETYDLMPEYSSMPKSEGFPRAIAAARKAVALNGSLSEAHRALGFALFYWDWNVPDALEEYQRALQLDPYDAEAHHWYATALLTLNRFPEARAEIELARELNPDSRSILADQALIGFWAGDDPALSISRLRRIERADPDFLPPPRYLALIFFAQKDFHASITESERAARISKDVQETAVARAAELGWSSGGEHGMLEAMRAEQQGFFESGQSSGFDLARTSALLGRRQEAVRCLEAAFTTRDFMLMTIFSGDLNAQLHGDPEFERLKGKVKDRMHPRT